MKTKALHTKRLADPDDFWQAMTDQNEDLKSTITEWMKMREVRSLKRKYQVCWVVGVILCEDTELSSLENTTGDREIRGEVPVGTVAELAAASQGVPLSTGGLGNLGAGTNRSSEKSSLISNAFIKGQRIFGLELKIISRSKREFKPGDRGPKMSGQYQLGADRDESETDSESLCVRDVEEDEWNALLDEDRGEEEEVDETRSG